MTPPLSKTNEVMISAPLEPGDSASSSHRADSLSGIQQIYPGPTALLGRSGVVLSANEEALPLIDALRAGFLPCLNDAIAGAIEGKVCEINPLVLEAPAAESDTAKAAGSPAAYDVQVLPWTRNATALLLARDVTLDRCRREALSAAKSFHETALAMAVDFSWRCDTEGRFLSLFPTTILGHRAKDLTGQAAGEFLVHKGGQRDNPFCSDLPLDDIEVLFRDTAGKAQRLRLTVRPQSDSAGTWTGCLGVARLLGS